MSSLHFRSRAPARFRATWPLNLLIRVRPEYHVGQEGRREKSKRRLSEHWTVYHCQTQHPKCTLMMHGRFLEEVVEIAG